MDIGGGMAGELTAEIGAEGALTLAAGAPVVAYLVGVLFKGVVEAPSRLLPALATVGGVLWVLALAAAGRVDGHPVALVLQGIVVGQAASGTQGWYRTYRSAGGERDAATGSALSATP